MEILSIRPEQARRPGRPEAAAVCFDWQSAPVVEAEGPSESMAARKRGLQQSLITATLAALLFVFLSERVGIVVGGVACVLLASSMLLPLSLYAWIESVVGRLAVWLQKGVTWLLMVMIFGLVFAPFSTLFRRGKRDKLKRWMEPAADSYWTDRTEPITAESRLRLY